MIWESDFILGWTHQRQSSALPTDRPDAGGLQKSMLPASALFLTSPTILQTALPKTQWLSTSPTSRNHLQDVPAPQQSTSPKECVPYLVSATTGGQWTQARKAAVKSWSTTDRCQLCLHEVGTIQHRFNCRETLPLGGWPRAPRSAGSFARDGPGK